MIPPGPLRKIVSFVETPIEAIWRSAHTLELLLAAFLRCESSCCDALLNHAMKLATPTQPFTYLHASLMRSQTKYYRTFRSAWAPWINNRARRTRRIQQVKHEILTALRRVLAPDQNYAVRRAFAIEILHILELSQIFLDQQPRPLPQQTVELSEMAS